MGNWWRKPDLVGRSEMSNQNKNFVFRVVFFPPLHEKLKLFCPMYYAVGALKCTHKLNSAANQVQGKNRVYSE